MIPGEAQATLIADTLRVEGKCAISLARSAGGKIRMSIRTHVFGCIDIDMDAAAFADVAFGLNEVECEIARVNPKRKPGYKFS